ncbi:TadG family pilus assembly protein [soil metagenome]
MKSPPPTRRAQRGSIIVNATIAMSLMVILLIGSELGYLFYLKRELQKTADLAALAGATSLTTSNCSAGRTAALTNANNATTGNMPPGLLPLAGGEVTCGRWTSAGTVTDPASRFTSATSNLNAVQVQLTRTPASLLAFFTGSRTITVHAVAAKVLPAAALSIRSTLITIDQSKSDLLNAVVGGLLGGNINPPITVLGWQGLVNTNVSLLDLLVQLGASAGTYDSVLQTNLTVKQLIDATLAVAQRNGSTVSAALTALQSLSTTANIAGLPQVKLGDLLGVATGTSSTGLDLDLQVFQLIQGMVQLANGSSAIAATIPITVAGVAGVTAQVKVIEKPQISSIGNPDLITPALGSSDPNRIYVRTAQIRTLFTFNLSGLTNTVSQLTNILSSTANAITPLTNFLSSVGSLSLTNLVPSLVGVVACGIVLTPDCTVSKVTYVSLLPTAALNLSIDSGSGSAYVTGHSCNGDGSTKSLTANAATSAADLRIGTISNAFSSSTAISVSPVPIVEIGYQESRYDSCLLSLICSGQKWKNSAGNFVTGQTNAVKTIVAGLGLKVDAPVAASSKTLTFSAPAAANLPDIDASPYSGTGNDPSYQSVTSTSLVTSLSATLGGIELQPYSNANSVLGSVLVGTIGLINSLISSLQGIINTALGPLLNPAVNTLLDALGVDLAKSDVGARMSCSRGAELVY